MKIRIALLLFCVGSLSCYSQHIILSRDSVHSLVKILKSRERVEGWYVGPTARPSNTYYMAELIITNSSDEELYTYTLDTAKVLSAYAFIGLVSKRRLSTIIDVWKAKMNDERMIEDIFGCLVHQQPINRFFAAQLCKRKEIWNDLPKEFKKSIRAKFSAKDLKHIRVYEI
jgi:hypothetical protein